MKKFLYQLTITFTFLSAFMPLNLAFAENAAKESPPAVTEESKTPGLLKEDLKAGEIFSCETDIFYTWIQEKEKQAPTAENPEVEKQEPNKEFYETLVERGMDGELSKTRLQSRITSSRSKALSYCKNQHNVPACTSEKLTLASSNLRQLDFQTKRTVTANLIKTCEDKAGRCLDAINTDILCHVFKSPDTRLKPVEKAAAPAVPAKK